MVGMGPERERERERQRHFMGREGTIQDEDGGD